MRLISNALDQLLHFHMLHKINHHIYHYLDYKQVTIFPKTNHNEEILKRVFLNYQQANLDEQMTQGIGCLELDEVFSYINAKKDILVEDTVIHGDYCLPNIFLDQDYRFCGWVAITVVCLSMQALLGLF